MERPSWLCLKVLRWFHFLKSRQRKCEKSFVHRTVTEGCKVINTTHRIPILFHYDISLKHTFSQILQQDEFFNSTKTKIKTTSCQILPLAAIPTHASMPTGLQSPHFLLAQPCPRPLEASPILQNQPQFQKVISPSFHKRLPPTHNFCYDRNYLTIGSLHPLLFLLCTAAAGHQSSLAVAPPWHVAEAFC